MYLLVLSTQEVNLIFVIFKIYLKFFFFFIMLLNCSPFHILRTYFQSMQYSINNASFPGVLLWQGLPEETLEAP